MMPEINIYVFLGIIAVFGLLWMNPPRKVFWKTVWWKRHICDDFPDQYDPHCFECNKHEVGACNDCQYKRW